MALLRGLLWPLEIWNTWVLGAGRIIAIVAIALMVVAIIVQVFFRYVLNNALPWPDEAARFCMLWMTGLIAPLAYRKGGFVAIDMLEQGLPRRAAAVLSLVLLLIALLVLVPGIGYGAKHVTSGCLFKSSTLWVPFELKFAVPIPLTGLDLTLCTKESPSFGFTWGWVKMPLAVMYASLYVGLILLTVVNIELILRNVITLLGGGEDLAPLADADMQGAE